MIRTLAPSFALVALLATPAILSVAAPTFAQGKASTSARLDAEFALSDANKDGALTRPEVNARMAKMKLRGTPATPRQAQALATIWFARADADKNGKVTRAELGKTFDRTFDQYDKNGDGTISPAERAAARASVGASVQGPAAPKGR